MIKQKAILHEDGTIELEQVESRVLLDSVTQEEVLREGLSLRSVLHPDQGDYIEKVAKMRDLMEPSEARDLINAIVEGTESSRNKEVGYKYKASRKGCQERDAIIESLKAELAKLKAVK